MKPPERYTLLLLAILAFCFVPQSDAGIQLTPNTWPDSDWSLRIYGTPSVGIVSLQGHNWLKIERSSADNGSGQVIYTGGSANESGAPVATPENQLGDIRGSVILGTSSWGDSLGVILRAEGASFNNNSSSRNAYYLALTNTGLGLYWGAGADFLSAVDVVQLSFNPYTAPVGILSASNNNQYLLDFSAIGLRFEATVWAVNDNGEKVGDALASISYLDERPEARESGYFGLRGGRYGGIRSGYFRNLEVEAIPEPSMAALVLLGVGVGIAIKVTRRAP